MRSFGRVVLIAVFTANRSGPNAFRPLPAAHAIFRLVRLLLHRPAASCHAILLVEKGSRGASGRAHPQPPPNLGQRLSRSTWSLAISSLPRGFNRRPRASTASPTIAAAKAAANSTANSPGPLFPAGNHLLRRARHDQVEMGAGPSYPRQGFCGQRERRLLLADRQHLGVIRQFVLLRSGLAGAGAVRTLARLFLFPFTCSICAVCRDRSCPEGS